MNFTPLNEAFQHNNPMMSMINNPTFSLHCIYCQSTQTAGLSQDGSFRQCLHSSCRKQFQAKINPPSISPSPSQSQQSHTQKQRHPNDYIMFNQEHLKQQPNLDQIQNQYIPNTIQQTQYTSFSHPNYDTQISKKQFLNKNQLKDNPFYIFVYTHRGPQPAQDPDNQDSAIAKKRTGTNLYSK